GISLRAIHWLDYWKDDGFDRLVAAIHKALEPTSAQEGRKPLRDVVQEQKFNQEIDHRLKLLPMLLEDVFTYTQLHTVKGAVHGEAEYHPRVGKLGEFEPLFPEFLGRSLFSLIWDLQQLLPDQEKERLQPALESAEGLPSFFNRLVLLVPVGNEDSK